MLNLNYKQKLALINANYASNSNGVLPFIHKNRITILKKGYYQKEKANYRGVGIIDNKVLLIGYYDVPCDMIILPENMEISEKRKNIINFYKNKNYNVVNGFPSFKIKEFDNSSEEFMITMGKRNEQKKNKK